MAKLGKLDDFLAHLARLDNLIVCTERGEVLRVVVARGG